MAGSPAKRVVGTVLFLLAIVALLGFYFILFADANQVENIPGAGNVDAIAAVVAVLLVLVAVVLIILLVSRSRRAASPVKEDPAFFVPDDDEPAGEARFEDADDLIVYETEELPVAKRSWGPMESGGTYPFYFPLNVEAGVYVNDYIPIGSDRQLKLRTLLAGPPDLQAATFVVPNRRAAGEEPRFREATIVPDRPRGTLSSDLDRAAGRDVPGDDFMRQLESRFNERRSGGTETVTEAPAEVYYDYKGDIHPVVEVEGIGPVYAERLGQHGIKTTARLCYEDAARISAKIDVPMTNVENWQAMAQLMKVSGIGPQYAEALVRAGIDGIDELKRRSAAKIADQVNEYLESLETTVVAQGIRERRVAGWQAAAKSMRRVRQSVPAE